ncbi:helix-turn-helix domain-containing protein [Ruegeria sp. SCPT10]|uniref:winged helix-turn-helix transcriptional regulator n=1 Tax=Ruegeria sp. SCP10 TaxID=3141377 RepID=UPI0033393259
MATPLPGLPSRGSHSGQPIMALFDLLGRRWTMRLLWELRSGPKSFRALQKACGGVSPSVMNTRLKELRASLLVENQNEGYVLTSLGDHLMKTLDPLRDWSRDWAAVLDEGG